ncbi:MAG: glycoside hydrolase family 127 protein [Prolixibacteraceae bacterium]|nr:glycoside hydrolase family 127 protein [Prolixibacteraceae bacterium]
MKITERKLLNTFVLFVLLAGIAFLAGCTQTKPDLKKLEPVSFTAVHINDAFWAPKIETNRTVSIPSAFHQCEINGRIDNFALAGGLIKGEHQGDFPFDDTDVYKIIEGAAYTLAVKYDPDLDAYLDSVIALIGVAQEPDGYLYTCITNKCERLRPWYGAGKWARLNSHELYNCGHLYEAAVAHYQATGKRSLLDIAIKNADMVDILFGPGEGQQKEPSGHPIIEMALVKLWRVTGENRYLKLAKFFIDETGKCTDGHRPNAYSQDHMPIVDQDEAVGHAVRLGYLYSGVTDVASLLNDTALIDASKRVWENVVSKKLYLTGGIGALAQGEGFGPNYLLPNMTSYCETCASIANVYWNYRLFLNNADSKYYDVLERTLYNGLISGVSLSGDKFFYDNPLESNHTHERAPWFGCACCPGNVTRFMASIPGYVYATSENTIFVNLFVGNYAEIKLENKTINLSQKTNYPWDGKVEIGINDPQGSDFDLRVRIPGWVNNQVVPSSLYQFLEPVKEKVIFRVNGKKVNPQIINGYACFYREWDMGDKIEIELPMKIRKIVANENVASDIGKIAYQRGPVVYCFEDKDNNDGWMFDTYISPNAQPSEKFESDLLGGVETFTINGSKIENGEKKDISLKAIPYYAWNNRGAANMVVWVPDSEKHLCPYNSDGIETKATPSGSFDFVIGLNDGFEPYSSTDLDKPYYSWWNKKDTSNWVEYSFDEPTALTQTDVYWLILDHYDGNYRMPESWKLQYKTCDNVWVDVTTGDDFRLEPDKYNTVKFEEVTTTAVRILAKFQPECSAGILEWKVK